MKRLRIVFAGSPIAAVPSLRAIAAGQHDVVSVVTRTPSQQGRKRIMTPTPVAIVATDLRIPLIETNRLTGDVTRQIADVRPDLGVIVAYGGLVREPLLSTPTFGWINLHFSLLPRWRGAAPVQRAIMAGDVLTGASVFQLVEELDAGPVLGTLTQGIGRNETAGHLLESLAESGAVLLGRVIDMIAEGTSRGEVQLGDVVFAPKLTMDDGQIDWESPAEMVHQRIRGVNPEPGAFTVIDGSRLKVLDALVARDAAPRSPGTFEWEAGRVLVGTTSEPVELVRVQPAGKSPMSAADWWRGRQAPAKLTSAKSTSAKAGSE